MVTKYFIGIDISKLTLDIALLSVNEVLVLEKIKHSRVNFEAFLEKAKAQFKCTRGNTVLCAENMGFYTTFLTKSARKFGYKIFLESPLQIKRSLGIQRGKNDALDATRIAEYIRKSHEYLKDWQRPRPVITKLRELNSIRNKLIKVKNIISSSRQVEQYFQTKSNNKFLRDHFKFSISAIKGDIEKIECSMDKIIANDDRLRHLDELITSVPRIGKVIARELIIYTNEFIGIPTARKFACYSGIAPYEWTSGTSVKGKSKVSHIARKELKSSMHIAAMGLLKSHQDSSLYKYYERKVAEDKNKMNVLNALRNKLVHRIYACVRDDMPYRENVSN